MEGWHIAIGFILAGLLLRWLASGSRRSATAEQAVAPTANDDAGADDAWTGFSELLSGWLDRRVRGENEPETTIPLAQAARAAPLERWAEVWENLRRSTDLSDEYNLDRKRTVLSVLMSLARATRM